MKNGYDMVDRMFEEIRNSEKHELSLESAFEFIEFYGLIDGCTLPTNFGKKEFVGNCALRALNNNFERLSIDDKGIDNLVELLINPNNYERYDFGDCLDNSDKANDFFKYVFAMAEKVKGVNFKEQNNE